MCITLTPTQYIAWGYNKQNKHDMKLICSTHLLRIVQVLHNHNFENKFIYQPPPPDNIGKNKIIIPPSD